MKTKAEIAAELHRRLTEQTYVGMTTWQYMERSVEIMFDLTAEVLAEAGRTPPLCFKHQNPEA